MLAFIHLVFVRKLPRCLKHWKQTLSRCLRQGAKQNLQHSASPHGRENPKFQQLPSAAPAKALAAFARTSFQGLDPGMLCVLSPVACSKLLAPTAETLTAGMLSHSSPFWCSACGRLLEHGRRQPPESGACRSRWHLSAMLMSSCVVRKHQVLGSSARIACTLCSYYNLKPGPVLLKMNQGSSELYAGSPVLGLPLQIEPGHIG